MLSVPRVATMAGTPRTATRNPLTIPRPSPSRTPKAIATGVSTTRSASTEATTNATSPIIDSTDRSTLRVMMTSA